MLTLYHYWSSVCSQKVRLCLAEKKLSFLSRHVDLFTFEHWEPFTCKINQKGVVPALDHDGKDHHQIECAAGISRGCLPRDPPASQRRLMPRAQMRIWIFNSEEIAHSNVNTASHNPRHAVRLAQALYARATRQGRGHLPEPDHHRALPASSGAWRERGRGEPGLSRARLSARHDGRRSQDRTVACRPRYSLADIAMAPFINRIEVLKRPEMVGAAKRPRLAEWWQRVQARPAFKEAFAFANPDTSDPIKR